MASRVKAGEAFVELNADPSGLQKGLQIASASMKDFGASVAKIGAGIAGVGAAITAPLAASVKKFADFGDSLDKMAARTSLSVETLSELRFAASQSGADIGKLEKAVGKMQKTVVDAGDGLSTAVRALDRLGLSADDLIGLSIEDQFLAISNAVGGIENDALRTATAMEVFGKSGTQLLPLFAQGADGLENMRREARELGLVLDTESATSAAALTDAMDKLSRIVDMIWVNIGSALAPALTELAEEFKFVGVEISSFIKENGELIRTIALVGTTLVAVGTAITTIGVSIAGLGFLLSGVSSAVGFFVTALSALGTALAVIAPAAAIIYGAFLAYPDLFNLMSDTFDRFAGNVSSQLGGIVSSVQTAVSDIRAAWEQGGIAGAFEQLAVSGQRVWEVIAAQASLTFATVYGEAQIFITDLLADLQVLGVEAWGSFANSFLAVGNIIYRTSLQIQQWLIDAGNNAINEITRRWLEFQERLGFDVGGELAAQAAEEQKQRIESFKAREAVEKASNASLARREQVLQEEVAAAEKIAGARKEGVRGEVQQDIDAATQTLSEKLSKAITGGVEISKTVADQEEDSADKQVSAAETTSIAADKQTAAANKNETTFTGGEAVSGAGLAFSLEDFGGAEAAVAEAQTSAAAAGETVGQATGEGALQLTYDSAVEAAINSAGETISGLIRESNRILLDISDSVDGGVGINVVG